MLGFGGDMATGVLAMWVYVRVYMIKSYNSRYRPNPDFARNPISDRLGMLECGKSWGNLHETPSA